MDQSQETSFLKPAQAMISVKGVSRVRAGHLWIYRSDVIARPTAESGSVVPVRDKRGRFIALAHYSAESEITLRLLSLQEREINSSFWRERLHNALAWRQQVVTDTDAYRLVYAEGDLLPGLIIDRYGDCFVIQTLTAGMERLKQMWTDLLLEEFKPRCIVERNDARVRQLEGLPLLSRVLYEAEASDSSDAGWKSVAEFLISENGIRFLIDLTGGQKTGAFLDQRENRAAAMHYGHGQALDCFSFHGSFALHLAKTCEQVTALDISESSIARAQRNAAHNAIANVEFIVANVFDQLHDYDLQGKRFDTIVLDPPAFAKNRGAVAAALRGYKEINLRALKLLNPGGILVTCSCSYHVSEGMFLEMLAEAASDAGRVVQVIEKRTQARDHPILLTVPETYYLKCVILRVI